MATLYAIASRFGYLISGLLFSLLLLSSCGGPPRESLPNVHVLACWNDVHGNIMLTVQDNAGIIRHFAMDPDFSPPCSVWQSRSRWSRITVTREEYGDLWVLEGAETQ